MEDKVKPVRLFDEFPPVTTADWEALVMNDLRGGNYEKLLWKTLEGFDVKPYYRSEDLRDIPFYDISPGEIPVTKGNKAVDNHWLIRQDFDVTTVEDANGKARKALDNGAESIGFVLNEDCHPGRKLFTRLLFGIDISNTELNFVLCKESASILTMLYDEFIIRKEDPSMAKGSLDFDPLGNLTLQGNFCCRSEQLAFQSAKNNIEYARMHLPHFRVITVNGQYFSNSGSSTVQELAFSLASGNEYLSQLTALGLTIDDAANAIRFNFGTGSNFFMEIARLRAARILWAKIVEAYLPHHPESMNMFINSFTTRWNKTIYDPHVNMLRATTESMSAIIGGTDSLSVEPFDITYKKPDEFSERFARNIQNICREEAYLGKVIEPAAGSYYIESLTQAITSEAWKYFLKVEESGGYTEALKNNYIQKEITEVANRHDINIAMRKEILLGTNQYPIPMENPTVIVSQPPDNTPASVRIVEPIKPYRGAIAFEELRRKTQSFASIPKVFLLPFGNLAMQKVRVNFSNNFFGCGGFEIIDNTGFVDIEAGISAAEKSKAEIVVLCSSDEDYAATVPEIFEKLKNKTIVVLAGYPKGLADEFIRMGLKHFIHIRSNVLETLRNFQAELGIT